MTENLLESDNPLDYNFWPSFSDLMLSLVLILILVIFSVYSIISFGTINLRHVQERQNTVVDKLTIIFEANKQQIGENIFSLSIAHSMNKDIIIQNEPTLQRFSFGTHILFPQDNYSLTDNGKLVLRKFGNLLKQELQYIREIQIQGHADPVPSRRFNSNLDLAALRAIEVFKFFQDSIGIDPTQHLMSATSFGEYKPVQRSESDNYYNKIKLLQDNATIEMMNRNRRIELLIFNRF